MNMWRYKWNVWLCCLLGHDWGGTTWVDGAGNFGPYYCLRCYARGEPILRFRKLTDVVGYYTVLKECSPDDYLQGYDIECKKFGYWDQYRNHHNGSPRDNTQGRFRIEVVA